MTRALVVLFAFLPTLAGIADDVPYLVRDLPGVTVRDSMSLGSGIWTTLGDTTWFAAFTTPQTMEVFKTDGSTGGTVRVTNGSGSPDAQGSGPFLGTTHGKLVYGGRDAGGQGLFALDTAGGEPILLARVRLQSLTNGVVRDGTLYFSAEKIGTSEQELWRTDGTPAGTELIDLLPGESGAFDSARDTRLFALGQALFFFGTTSHGMGLHRTDGTSANTTLLLPLSTSALFNNTGEVFALGDRLLFFLSRENERKDALWATDGSAIGTTAVAELPGFSPLGVLGGNLLFEDSRDAIWTTDGTTSGTHKTDVLGDEKILVHGGSVLGNQLYFYAVDFYAADFPPVDSYTETLYVTQGTAATTRAIMEIEHDGGHTIKEGFALGDKFYFRHDDGIHGRELWRTDGTTTQMFLDINPSYRSGIDWGPSAELRPDGTAIFVATGVDTGAEPWITDGTASGTRLLANIAAEDPTHGSSPHLLRAIGERVFFIATLTGGEALGVSDGSSAGTRATLVDFNSSISTAGTAGNRYIFSTSVADPFGLYATDGSLAGTSGIYQGRAGPLSFGNGVLFEAEQSVWFSDGTLAGTRRLHRSSTWTRILPAGDVGWFSDNVRWWKTDGTEEGTVEIVPTEPRRSEIFDLIRSGELFFLIEAGSISSGPKLWRSDGTSAGTRVVKAFQLPPSDTPNFIGATDHLVYLSVDGKLHRSDGTGPGTIDLGVTAPCDQSAVLGDTLIFTSVAAGGVLTLWRSDGTMPGTTKLVTMTAPHFVYCSPLVAHGNVAYFKGWDAAHGWEPWVTDGTVTGTKILADLYPGATNSTPAELTVAGERVFFTADSPNTGRELWAIGPRPRRRAAGHR